MFDIIYGNANTEKFSITLADAQRIRSKIHNSIGEFRFIGQSSPQFLDMFKVSISDILYASSNTYWQRILESQFDEQCENLSESMALQIDALKMKEKIFRKNLEVGISEKLNKREILNLMLKRLEQVNVSSSLKVETIENIKNKAQSFYTGLDSIPSDQEITINYPFYDIEKIKQKKKELKKEIFQIDQEITKLNAENEIEVDLYEYTSEKIGLK